MALAERAAAKSPKGVTAPRIAPPLPAKSLIREYEAAAAELGISLMPWQKTAARYLTATNAKRWRYRAVTVVVARQNGKTHLLLPLILMRLRAGRRILHTAQNRIMPRETFLALARALNGSAEVTEIRFANGQELIRFANGGRYTLVAPRPGVRGYAVDDVLLDEVLEQKDYDLIAAIKPTMTASRDPQIVYLSNAGNSDSVVLNDLRRRANTDDLSAYLEWSAAPDRNIDDPAGWAEANPALGITVQMETLADDRATLPISVFETEHLCRWVVTMQPRLVGAATWANAEAVLDTPLRPVMGVKLAANSKSASAAIAWHRSDGTIALQIVADVYGDPIDTDKLGKELQQLRLKLGAPIVGYDAWTDTELAKYFKDARAIGGREYANASENFVRVLDGGRLRWSGAEQVGEQIGWTTRKPHESGAWMAVPVSDEHPTTAVEAAIRAVWLASGPKPGAPRVL